MQVEPDTKIMHPYFRRQTRLKAGQVMRTFARQAKGIQQLVIDRFNDLPDAGQPPSQRFRPAFSLAALMRWGDDLNACLHLPASVWLLASKAFICYVVALGRQPSTRQTRTGMLASRKQGRGQQLVVCTGCPKAKAGNHPHGINAQQQMEAFVPAQTITPAYIGLACQPAAASTFGIAGHRRGTIQRFIQAVLGFEQFHQIQAKGGDRITLVAHQPIELAAIGQSRKCGPQMQLSIAIKGTFAGKLHPLAKQSQSDDLTAAQAGLWSRMQHLGRQMSFAKIIAHHVQCGQEGFNVYHQLAPFLSNVLLMLTVGHCYLPFPVLSISHQTFKKLTTLIMALGMFVIQAFPTFACGALVAPNGSVRLSRAATLVAWHDGVERYLTSFSYQGDFSHLGWIVPLPAVPLKIEEGGAWTLQRLFLETHPVELRFGVEQAAATADSAAVLQQVKIEALNLTVIRGSGQEVLNWATSNNFFLNTETREHLLAYAKGSPIFMAAKYDTSAAKSRGLFHGDVTPILITMKTAHIWVPLEVLAIEGQQVQADLYLLTDQPVYTTEFNAMVGQSSVGSEIPGASGFVVSFQEKLTPTLYHDLSTDRNMGWVRSDGWLTYLNLDAPEPTVTYDLGVSSSGVIRLAPYGTPPMAVVDGQSLQQLPAWLPRLPLGAPQVLLAVIILLSIGGGVFWIVRGKRRARVRA